MKREAAKEELFEVHDYVAFYSKHVREGWGDALSLLIPEHMHHGVVCWVVFGYKPGHFLSALIEGDFYEMINRADDVNRNRFADYARFFYNYSPSGCWGRGALKDWKGMLPETVPNDREAERAENE
jgi:hypothetical protein